MNKTTLNHKPEKSKLPVTLLSLAWGKLLWGNFPVGRAKTWVVFLGSEPSFSEYLKSKGAYNCCSKKLTKLIINISQWHKRNTC